MKETVEDYIFKGGVSHRIYGSSSNVLKIGRCAFSVTEHGRITDWHQCERKPVEEIDGYSFCKVHAREVKRRLGKHQDTITRYAASFNYGKPYLAEIQVVRETEHMIDIAEIKALIGDSRLYTGNQRKESRYTDIFVFFDTAKEAHRWLLKEAEEHVAGCRKSLALAEEVYSKLLRKGI